MRLSVSFGLMIHFEFAMLDFRPTREARLIYYLVELYYYY